AGPFASRSEAVVRAQDAPRRKKPVPAPAGGTGAGTGSDPRLAVQLDERPVVGRVNPRRRASAVCEAVLSRRALPDEGRTAHDGTIHDLPALGEVGLALDGTVADFTADGPPRFFWWVDDLVAVRAHLDSLDVEVVGDVQDIGSVSFLQFRDPDGNLLMACARK
ncbi:hypothetical protein ACWFQT_16140, partial [Cellulosimicrobium cellulans]